MRVAATCIDEILVNGTRVESTQSTRGFQNAMYDRGKELLSSPKQLIGACTSTCHE